MNEEEIVKQVDLVIKWISKIGLIKERQALLRLLDLYNKEKDKNASLKKEIKLMKSININDNYISKEKIKEMIKEIGTYTFDSEEEIKKFDYCIYILQELLEEE